MVILINKINWWYQEVNLIEIKKINTEFKNVKDQT